MMRFENAIRFHERCLISPNLVQRLPSGNSGSAKRRDKRKQGRGKVVLITGCSVGGIGYALAEEFARRGATVYATARRLEAMDGLAELGVRLLPLDVTCIRSIQEAISRVTSECDCIDVLVNNAGFGAPSPVAEIPLDRLRLVYETNVFGAVALSQAVFPHMAEHGSGTIINMSSVSSYTHRPFTSAYSGSKAALNAVTNCMRVEMKPFGIRVVLVTPGYIRTNIFSKTVADMPSIPDDSLYKHLELRMCQSYEYRAADTGNPPASDLAERIADAAFANRPPIRVVFGRHAYAGVLFGSLPSWLQDWVSTRLYGKGQNL
ncbi:hypothetical protein CLOP_g23370 [Closterium sp. NIES-67]|nr:hypothetical protein CLOP_g23370 [Closterium sp. NIES-67]